MRGFQSATFNSQARADRESALQFIISVIFYGCFSTRFTNERLLVVSAHAADFVWRAGGIIASYASRGARARVLCLSYGERGESQGLWKKEGMTIEKVREIRHAEAVNAAEVLGAEIRCFNVGDYPLGITPQLTEELVQEFRSFQPTCRVDAYAG